MRSNRPSYSATPAGSAKALDQKPRPKRSKREWNQLMLMLFFMVLPVMGLLAIFFQPVRWVFMAAVVLCLVLMWVAHAFLFPGRMILSAVYGLLFVFTLVTALSAKGSSPVMQQSGFVTMATAVPTQTPAFSNMYSTMGTSVPDGYYDDETDALDGLQEVGVAGGSEDESGEDLGLSDAGVTEYVSAVKSDAEIALENFMEKWRKGIIADMVEYTAPSWQNAQQDSASQQLFWKFAQKPLIDWRQLDAPTGTDASTARTITIQADVTYGGETRTYQYDALTLFENDAWYVDPDSLSTGVLATAVPPTPDPNATPTPTPEPTPTPTINPSTVLYYNKSGGEYYHADKECSSVNKKYFPLSSFKYSELSKDPYSKLKPCTECNAPERP